MNKRIKGLVAAGLMALVFPFQALAAADAETAFKSTGENRADVSVSLNGDSAAEGVNALQLQMKLNLVAGSLSQADVNFKFNEKLPGTVHEFRFDEETNELTVYVAGANGKLFNGQTVDLGQVEITSASGDYLEVTLSTGGMSQEEDSKDLVLLTGRTNKSYPTMQYTTATLKDGESAPAPTPAPTEAPVESTATPSATAKPTNAPGATATAKPTNAPSATATAKPTNAPSATATAKPTAKPTDAAGTVATATPNPTAQPAQGSTGANPSTNKTTGSNNSSSSEPVSSESVSSSQSESSSVAASAQQDASSQDASSQASSADSQLEANASSNGLAMPIVVAAVVVVAAAAGLGVMFLRRPKQ